MNKSTNLRPNEGEHMSNVGCAYFTFQIHDTSEKPKKRRGFCSGNSYRSSQSINRELCFWSCTSCR